MGREIIGVPLGIQGAMASDSGSRLEGFPCEHAAPEVSIWGLPGPQK